MAGKNGVENEREDGIEARRERVGLKKPTTLPNVVSFPIASTDPSLHVPMLNQLSVVRSLFYRFSKTPFAIVIFKIYHTQSRRPQSTGEFRSKDGGTMMARGSQGVCIDNPASEKKRR